MRIKLTREIKRVDGLPSLPAGAEFDVIDGSLGLYVGDKPGICKIFIGDEKEFIVYPEFEIVNESTPAPDQSQA